MEMILKMPFFSCRNINVQFAKVEKLTWQNYTVAIALLTTKEREFINKKKFTASVYDKKTKTFVFYMLALLIISLLLSKQA